VRVIVADDSVLLREGVTRLLEEAGFEVVGQAADRDELMRKTKAHKPDIAIIDIRMPPTHTDEGLQAAREIREQMPDTGVLVLSAYLEEEYALELLGEDAAGVGYLLKDRVSDGDRFAGAAPRSTLRLSRRCWGGAGRRTRSMRSPPESGRCWD
jgi:DNA-binding NarL/FixJ family response regulator